MFMGSAGQAPAYSKDKHTHSSSLAMIFHPPNVASKNPALAGIQIQSGPRFPIQSVLPQLAINGPQGSSLAI